MKTGSLLRVHLTILLRLVVLNWWAKLVNEPT
jgi:hypothetical protein